MDDWLRDQTDDEDLWYRLTIPADLKEEFRFRLDIANINERMLLPGLEGICAWLNRRTKVFPTSQKKNV